MNDEYIPIDALNSQHLCPLFVWKKKKKNINWTLLGFYKWRDSHCYAVSQYEGRIIIFIECYYNFIDFLIKQTKLFLRWEFLYWIMREKYM